ncbi:hypothetical protein ABGB18_34200 [Nonomuraea sp. B12E4]|uniref:MarR family winged helix-turn-helix transcriptional regulator n=1 Tax=Nonomuraea sp. B12E4 TaxID=3153564 RepID=UPI00325EA5F1
MPAMTAENPLSLPRLPEPVAWIPERKVLTVETAPRWGGGLVERRRDPSDGRIVLVVITDAGREVLRHRAAARVAFVATLIGKLDETGQRALADATPALRHMIDQAAVPAALAAARKATEHLGE